MTVELPDIVVAYLRQLNPTQAARVLAGPLNPGSYSAPCLVGAAEEITDDDDDCAPLLAMEIARIHGDYVESAFDKLCYRESTYAADEAIKAFLLGTIVKEGSYVSASAKYQQELPTEPRVPALV